jgi:parvulin-like peptidyl-prolyl isomerase
MRISGKLAAAAAFFVIAAVVAGCGSSSIPGNSVASVAGNPITLQAVNHWMYVAAKDQAATAAQEGQTEPVVTAPDPPQFTDCIKQIRSIVTSLATASDKTLRKDCKEVFAQFMPEVMAYLIEGYWYQADANKLGITYSTSAQNKELATVKKEFKTASAFNTYLKESGETQADLDFQIRVSGLYNKLLTHYEKPVSSASIAAYYKSHLAEFATQATRTGHLIRVKTASGAAAAAAALKAGTSWDAVAKKYAEDSTSQKDGGAIAAVTANTYETAVNKALFSAPKNTVEGPIKGVFGYYVIEVTAETAGLQKTLAQESATIKTTLENTAKQNAATKITAYSKSNWGKQTLCRTTYSVADCNGYVAPKAASTSSGSASSGSASTTAASTTTASGSTATTSSTATGTTSSTATGTTSSTATSTTSSSTAGQTATSTTAG